MMSYVCYGSARTRITLYAADGTTPLQRVTLQKETREGLLLTWVPEGTESKLGSGANYARHWAHNGFRPTLGIKWDKGVKSTLETWASGAWGPATVLLTPIALSYIFNKAMVAPCLVEPHLDKDYSFKAQPDPGKPFSLRGIKGVAHSDLELVLIAEELSDIPDWAAL